MEAASRRAKSRRISAVESQSFDIRVETIVGRVKPSDVGEHNAVQVAFMAVADHVAGQEPGQAGQYRFTVPAEAMGWDQNLDFSLYVEFGH